MRLFDFSLRKSRAATARYAVDLRCPFDRDVENGLLGGGEEVEQSLGATGLHLLDQNPVVLAADDAELANVVERRRLTYIVVEDKPAVEKRREACIRHIRRGSGPAGVLATFACGFARSQA